MVGSDTLNVPSIDTFSHKSIRPYCVSGKVGFKSGGEHSKSDQASVPAEPGLMSCNWTMGGTSRLPELLAPA